MPGANAVWRVPLLGEERLDVTLVHKLDEELHTIADLLAAQGRRSQATGTKKLLDLRVDALSRRCTQLAVTYPGTRKQMIDVMERVAVIPAASTDALAGAQQSLEQLRADAPVEEPAAAPEATKPKAPSAAAEKPAAVPKVSTDDEAHERLAEFYESADPQKSFQSIKTIWSRNKMEAATLHAKLLAKYEGKVPKAATEGLAWLLSYTPAAPEPATPGKPAEEQPATTPAPGNDATPRGGRGYVGGLLARLATPVARMFVKEDEDVPQAIFPDNRGEWNKELGRWVFPDDPEGEAEREALAKAMAGPPPPPAGAKPAGSTPTAPGEKKKKGPQFQYVDAFGAGKAASAPAPVPMPPMPPAPVSEG